MKRSLLALFLVSIGTIFFVPSVEAQDLEAKPKFANNVTELSSSENKQSSRGPNVILEVQDSITNNSPVLSDGSGYNQYSFEGRSGQQVVITMQSRDFETYLFLVDANNNIVAHGRSTRSTNTESDIRLSLPQDGTYTIIANAFYRNGRGRYNLSVTSSLPNVTNSESGFDRAIQGVGGIRRGEISYLSYSSQFNSALHAAVRRTFSDIINDSSISNEHKNYSYVEFDINGDGREDAFVEIHSPQGAGSGGSHTWLFRANGESYELVGTFLHQISLVILPSRTSGWSDILRVPGKIFMPHYGAFYSQCSYNFRDYENCQDVQRNSLISGIVIDTLNRRSAPRFSLLRQ